MSLRRFFESTMDLFVSWANSSVGTQSCPNPPGRSAERSDLNRSWYVRVLDSTSVLLRIPGPALHGQNLQTKKVVGSLVSS